MKRYLALAIAALLFAGTCFAAQLSRLHSADIQTGGVIQAGDLNDEFNQLVNESNSQDTRLTDIESNASTFAGIKTFSVSPRTNGIDERTSGSGVTIDSVLLKDGFIRVPAGAGYTPATNGDIGYDSTSHTYDVYVNGSAKALATTDLVGYPPSFKTGPPPVYTDAATVTIKAGFACRDASNAADIYFSSDQAVAISSAGANGLDTGSEASGTWYHLWAIKNVSAGTVAGLLSTSSSAPTMPSGYTVKRLIGAVRNDGSSNFIPFVQYQDGWVYWTNFESTASYRVLNQGTSTSFAAQSLATLAPTTSKLVKIQSYVEPNGNNGNAWVRATGSGLSTGINVGSTAGATNSSADFVVQTNASQSIDYLVGSGVFVSIFVRGYQLTEVP